MTVDEFHECDEALRRDPRVIEALARRGITDLDRVLIDTWAYGAHLVPEAHRGGRVGWADVWYRSQEGSSPYANPVTGLHFVVDLNRMELLEIEDDHRVDEPATMGEYVPHLVPGLQLRDDLKPLEITQPEGVSFTLDGNALRWQKWSLRVGFNHREGMVLHTVGYDDGGRSPVAHRLSFAEMVVPYRDPTTDHYRRTAFDIGEWGLGFMTTSLELGCDCLGEIAYLDAVMHDTRGEPYAIRNAICIHEEDDAVLWKHVDARGRRRGPPRAPARPLLPRHRGQLRVPRLLAPLPGRQHRVRGARDRDHGHDALRRGRAAALRHARRRAHLRPVPPALPRRPPRPRRRRRGQHRLRDASPRRCPIGPDNPHGLALVQRNTPLRTEQEGKQDYDWQHASAPGRSSTRTSTNGLGTPVGYKLVPGGAFPPMMRPGLARAPAAPQAIGHTLWVTPFHADERWPCGEFVVQSEQDRGLPVWTAQDRSIEDTDVVLWYVFGIHHITRPEEWPVMSVDTVSFWLKPVGFFDRNPALDVAPSAPPLPLAGGPMSIEITNFIHGERVAAADGADDRADRPEHRRGVRDRAAVAARPTSTPRSRTPRARSRSGATRRRASASARCCGSPTRSRSAPTSSSTVESQNTGKPIGADDGRRRSRRCATRSASSPAPPACSRASRPAST